jgi:hypothetical protein
LRLLTALIGLSVIASGLHASADDPPKRPFVPTSAYVNRQVEGWTVRVNRALLDERKELGDRALALLEQKLKEIEDALPAKELDRLHEVPIWLGVDDGHAPCAEYHPNRQWLKDNGYNPDKAKAVEIGNAQRFLDWSPTQPSMILHELAHAYHDQVLGFDNPAILAAFEAAKQSGRYEKVRHADGRELRSYALTDAKEFFAEMTESTFGRNDFYPFTRDELEQFDPESAHVVREMWDPERNTARHRNPTLAR